MDSLPRVVLLDLKLPRRSGFDVLAWMKSHDKLRGYPL
jgi:DNA-binding response OmpR family regulator